MEKVKESHPDQPNKRRSPVAGQLRPLGWDLSFHGLLLRIKRCSWSCDLSKGWAFPGWMHGHRAGIPPGCPSQGLIVVLLPNIPMWGFPGFFHLLS